MKLLFVCSKLRKQLSYENPKKKKVSLQLLFSLYLSSSEKSESNRTFSIDIVELIGVMNNNNLSLPFYHII